MLFPTQLSLQVQKSTNSSLFCMHNFAAMNVLEKNNGNFTAAADQLGVTRQTLYNRLKKTDK